MGATLEGLSSLPRIHHPIITGIGSRNTPQAVLEAMTRIGARCRELGVYVRSGHADGADWAFEQGAQEKGLVFIPWNGFNGHLKSAAAFKVLPDPIPEAVRALVDELHPNPAALTQGARRLHSRNVFQVLGVSLRAPSQLVVCWTPGGKAVGGTATAIRLAQAAAIPVLNMFDVAEAEVLARIEGVVRP